MNNYLDVEYPDGIDINYASRLVDYIVNRYGIKRGKCLLDVGAGRGEFVKCFHKKLIWAYGTDSDYDLETEFPYLDKTFDYVFSKSFLEHINNTQFVLGNVRRVLRDHGVAIFLVPDWETQWVNFYDDSTHVKPFTQKGLEQAFKLAGFSDVKCEKFCTLSFTFNRPWLLWLPHLIDWFIPDKFKYKRNGKQRTLVRFSKEWMLLLSAGK